MKLHLCIKYVYIYLTPKPNISIMNFTFMLQVFQLLIIVLQQQITFLIPLIDYSQTKLNRIEQLSKLMPKMVQAHMESYCPSGESCSLCLQPLAEKCRCIDCLTTQVCKSCLLTEHNRPHLHIFGRYTYKHSARTNVKNYRWIECILSIIRYGGTIPLCEYGTLRLPYFNFTIVCRKSLVCAS